MKIRNLIPHLILICYIPIYSQIISGTIYDKTTQEVLPGASIYLDGTTIGTVSNLDGKFELTIKNSSNSALIITYLGYETVFIQPNEFGNLNDVFLQESSNQLEEVILEPDGWSRAKKLRIFRSEFLGKTIDSKKCKILNEEDIILIYSKSKNTLIAYSKGPIIIRNKYLGYEIKYNLVDFEVEFITDKDGFRFSHKVYMAGTSFFTDLSNKTRKKLISKREKEYYGSLIHFMRSLSKKQLKENHFDIYYKSFATRPYKHFNVSQENNQTKVEINVETLSVLYNEFEQSSIEFTSNNYNFFHIDENGNHSPPNSLLFSGYFGLKRISNMLPLNYIPRNIDPN